jgi:hypothetical protein
MPKPKPNQIIRHEIVLGRTERELIESGLTAYSINKISTPLVALLSDVSAMTLIFSAIAGILGWKFILSPGLTEAGELYNDFINQYDAWKAAGGNTTEVVSDTIIDSVTGIPIGSPATRTLLRELLDSLF